MTTTTQQIIEVGKALLPYLRADVTSEELGIAAFNATAALKRAAPEDNRNARIATLEAALREIEFIFDGQEDIDGNGGPNDAMKALTAVRDALAAEPERQIPQRDPEGTKETMPTDDESLTDLIGR